jgi:hypothetical protein
LALSGGRSDGDPVVNTAVRTNAGALIHNDGSVVRDGQTGAEDVRGHAQAEPGPESRKIDPDNQGKQRVGTTVREVFQEPEQSLKLPYVVHQERANGASAFQCDTIRF